MAKDILALAAMEKLLKRAGAPRVSEDSKAAMARALEDYAESLGKKAVRLSAHAGRRTVKKEDIEEALRH